MGSGSGFSIEVNTFAMSFTVGVNLIDAFDISYTLRTNFENASNKISIGYTYRFK
jgi:hypothetical protein